MSYGISVDCYEILKAAGLTAALNLAGPSAHRRTFIVETYVDGKLDESFEVRPEMADDVATALYAAAMDSRSPESEGIVHIYAMEVDGCYEQIKFLPWPVPFGGTVQRQGWGR